MDSFEKRRYESTSASKLESVPVTRFVIDMEHPIAMENVRSGCMSLSYDIGMGRRNPGESASYYALSDLSKTEMLEFFIRSESGIRKIDLPTVMLEKIALFV